MTLIQRLQGVETITIASGATVSGAVDLQYWAAGSFLIPTGWSGGATVSFQIAEATDGTFGDAKIKATAAGSDTAISMTVTAADWYPFPEEVMTAGAAKIVAVGATGAIESIILSLKG